MKRAETLRFSTTIWRLKNAHNFNLTVLLYHKKVAILRIGAPATTRRSV